MGLPGCRLTTGKRKRGETRDSEQIILGKRRYAQPRGNGSTRCTAVANFLARRLENIFYEFEEKRNRGSWQPRFIAVGAFGGVYKNT